METEIDPDAHGEDDDDAGTVLSLMPNSWPTMLALMKLRRRKYKIDL